MGYGNGYQVVVGSVLDMASAQRLVVCPYFKRVVFSREWCPNIHHFWKMCCLDKEHCDFHGRRLKFKPCFAGVRVAWVCPKAIGLPNLEMCL